MSLQYKLQFVYQLFVQFYLMVQKLVVHFLFVLCNLLIYLIQIFQNISATLLALNVSDSLGFWDGFSLKAVPVRLLISGLRLTTHINQNIQPDFLKSHDRWSCT